MKKKPGRWSKQEMAYLKKYGPDCHTPQDIQKVADHLKRSVEAVENKMVKENWMPVPMQEKEQNVSLLTQLHSTSFWPLVQNECNENELKYFEETWIDYLKQFREDILASEKSDLRHLIMTDIQISRTRQGEKAHAVRINEIEDELDEEQKKPNEDKDIDRIKYLKDTLNTLRSALMGFTNRIDKFMSQRNTLSTRLKSTRDQRIKRVEGGTESWVGFLRMIEDAKKRKQVGEMAHKMKLAGDNAEKDLGEYTQYLDNTVDIPLLTPERVQELED
jgi:hypothetical protein